MKYRLVVNVYSKEMGGQPVPIALAIPGDLARLITHLTVTHVKLTVDEDIGLTTVPLLDFKDHGAKPETDRPELDKRLFGDNPLDKHKKAG